MDGMVHVKALVMAQWQVGKLEGNLVIHVNTMINQPRLWWLVPEKNKKMPDL